MNNIPQFSENENTFMKSIAMLIHPKTLKAKNVFLINIYFHQ
jgi:hypothetical protein